jgi:clan AA aspartic protease (TIGR02281 family)
MSGGGWPLILVVAAGGTAAIAAIPTPRSNLPAQPTPSVVQPVPTPRSAPDARQIVLTADDNGNFDVPVTFTGPRAQSELMCHVDTGANVTSIQEEQAIALNFRDLSFSDEMHTANGVTLDAPITLPAISIAGRFTVNNVKAEVARDLYGCLLGMNVLAVIRVSFTGKTMELSW